MHQTFAYDRDGRAMLDLRDAAARHDIQLPDLPDLSDEARAIAVRTWRGRMVNEHLSAQVWGSLVGQAMRATLPADVLSGIVSAAADELRHAELCASVVRALGGVPVAPLPPIERVPEHADVGPLEAVLRNLLSVGCMSETVAVSVIRAEHAELEGSALGDVLAGILADEVQHARLGWRVLGQCAPRLSDEAKQRLSAYLVDALSHQVAYEVPRLPVLGAVDPAAARAGVCDGGDARRIFVDTIEQVIVPGLERAGLSADHAWKQARVASAHYFSAPLSAQH